MKVDLPAPTAAVSGNQAAGVTASTGVADEVRAPLAAVVRDNHALELRVEALESKVNTILPHLATKSDVAELRADVANGRADINKLITENQRWTHSAMVAIISLVGIGLIGLVLTFWNATRSQLQAPAPAAAVAQPPIIINVPGATPAPAAPASK